jgi:hypothetical protein
MKQVLPRLLRPRRPRGGCSGRMGVMMGRPGGACSPLDAGSKGGCRCSSSAPQPRCLRFAEGGGDAGAAVEGSPWARFWRPLNTPRSKVSS